jgi:predicted metal-dependent enzyme (double-stranded beta helix superfamily)
MTSPIDTIAPLRAFVVAMTGLVGRTPDEPTLLCEARAALATLIARDDWLPDAFAQPASDTYRQYLLHCDPLERFSVVSFVWGPGHRTPVHDHTVWGLVGVLRGAERCMEYAPGPDGVVRPTGAEHLMQAGAIDAVSPSIGDWHVVYNATDRVTVSIHVYGGNIGAVRRHAIDPGSGQVREFISGYALPLLPNLWDRAHAD